MLLENNFPISGIISAYTGTEFVNRDTQTMISTERLKGVEVFVAVAKAGSFTRAADKLHLTSSAVGKTVARLEARLGVRLFERSTRSLALTDGGTRFLASCTRVLSELEEAEHALRDEGDVLEGRVRIDLPVTYGRLVVLPVLIPFFQRHPRIQPVLSMTDRYVDLNDEGIDVGVRVGSPAGSPAAWPPALGHRYLGQEQKVFCAAPAYLAAHPAPASVAALHEHAAIMYGKADGTVSPWLLRRGHAVIEQPGVSAQFVAAQFVAGNAEAQLELTLAGLGIAQLPTWLVGKHLEAGSLVTVLPAQATPGLPIHVVWPQAKAAVPRVRQVVAALTDALGATTADQAE
jgi:DNA-binding transcriptional LysR family regulator